MVEVKMARKVLPVIMCGGAGTRVWPESRESMPKQFIPLIGAASTFQQSIKRLGDLMFDEPVVVTNHDYRFVAREQLEEIGAKATIVIEPTRRDSGPAVAIAAEIGAARHPELEAVIAESPFSRAEGAVKHFAKLFYGIPAFPFMSLALVLAGWRLGVSVRTFAPIEVIGKIAPRPLLLIHAERDERIPLNDTQELMAAAGEPKELWIAPGAGHGEPWMVAKEELKTNWSAFLERYLHHRYGPSERWTVLPMAIATIARKEGEGE